MKYGYFDNANREYVVERPDVLPARSREEVVDAHAFAPEVALDWFPVLDDDDRLSFEKGPKPSFPPLALMSWRTLTTSSRLVLRGTMSMDLVR